MKGGDEAVGAIAKTFGSLGGLLIMFVMIAQFIALFSWSNLPTVAAVEVAHILENANVPAVILLVLFILVIVVLDIILPGVVPKWAIFAPIFVPIFAQLGVAPQTLLAAYRVGDSPMNVLTPLMVYLPFIVTDRAALSQGRRHRHDHRADDSVHVVDPGGVDRVVRRVVRLGHPVGTRRAGP